MSISIVKTGAPVVVGIAFALFTVQCVDAAGPASQGRPVQSCMNDPRTYDDAPDKGSALPPGRPFGTKGLPCRGPRTQLPLMPHPEASSASAAEPAASRPNAGSRSPSARKGFRLPRGATVEAVKP